MLFLYPHAPVCVNYFMGLSLHENTAWIDFTHLIANINLPSFVPKRWTNGWTSRRLVGPSINYPLTTTTTTKPPPWLGRQKNPHGI